MLAVGCGTGRGADIARIAPALRFWGQASYRMKKDLELKSAGFTDSGAKRYDAATKAYCDELFAKAVAMGDRDKAPDTAREVTHEHVRGAAAILAVRGQDEHTGWQIFSQAGEYICAALAGVGGGKLEHTWGIILFGISLTVGVVLFVTRITRSRAV